ncbi:aspartate kinase [Microbulbifer yueqingensis]|uniref:Aspartokinase n=1 Tax=Microbulbifer yueqingensis TaxID=658219 RepID=A0A1G8YB98_9GAMM|nr:aspartate kinase [Microbulbifer yueqingensis]SDJ99330.1 aspartate kinase [Microbulbifer yueqingensis]
MADIIVSKFGGSSVANAGQIQKVRRIVEEDSRRRIVVVSAPGRSKSSEQKITDHLFNIATDGMHFRDQRLSIPVADSKLAVIERFTEILQQLDISGEGIIEALKQDLDCKLRGDRRVAFLASRGEHYNARIIAEYFQASGMEAEVGLPEDFGLLVSEQFLNASLLQEAYGNMQQLGGEKITVVPGFYGVTKSGEVAVFSRGGSDLTGGEIARGVHAASYENWTDVSGVFEADPRLVPEARAIPRLTFKEIRLLSSKGFNVFHLNAMLPCKERKIPIHIRNTNAPEEGGTVILFERVPEEGVVGVARLDSVAYIYLEKDMLGEEIGFTADLLGILREFGIQTYHFPTDKDDIAVLVNQDDLTGAINDLRRRIEQQLKPDFMDVVYNLSILTAVGLGLQGNSYPIVDALSALGKAHIPIEMIDQSPSQICFHIGVQQTVADDALKILYRALIG